MDIEIELEETKTPIDLSLEIGRFEDLKYLVTLLNDAWEAFEYRLEKVAEANGLYVFIEDPINADEYDCGVIEKHGELAYAISPAVHEMIMDAYQRYVDEFGEPDIE